ncbi:MAG: 30S ribosomal protein S1 [Caulobacterales bacterium]|nr:30S ribosomal protein S1 [Caulobacterales bacterium]MCA0373973.1 30S ribosomal protein S1 [Pseudomonadota bacterium]
MSSLNPTRDEFAAMFDASFGDANMGEGKVVAATILSLENDFAVLDVGLKTEGRVPLREFGNEAKALAVGQTVEVYLDRIENALGEAVVSREKARREEAWTRLEEQFAKGEQVQGSVVGRVKGGFNVDLGGANAFLPGSQVDVRPIRDVGPMMNVDQPFVILKMDRQRGNIVVSRRSILENERNDQRGEVVAGLAEGEIKEGTVKNITDYGAFVDLGGVDGLLHVTDISWKRISHPAQVLNVGDVVKVQIVKINPDTHRISLGMKQLNSDPWELAQDKYAIGTKLSGKITNITDYGAFVELEDGVEGLVHVSEMSWTKKNVHPSKIVTQDQEVDVIVIDVDGDKRRISLGMKQAQSNPWEAFAAASPVGSVITGEIKNITEFGLFVGVADDLDGMVHMSDIDWALQGEEAIKKFKKGDEVSAKVLDVDVEKERISLGIKQVGSDPLASSEGVKKGQTVTCTVVEIATGGIEVSFGADNVMRAFIRKSDLSRDRAEQRPERFAVGDRVDAVVTAVDKATRKVSLSIKALEVAEEKDAIAQFGSTDSGASLGDILGAALKKKETEQ